MTNAQLNALAALAVQPRTRITSGAMPLPFPNVHQISAGAMQTLLDAGLVRTDGYDYALSAAGVAECRTRHIPVRSRVADATTQPQKAKA